MNTGRRTLPTGAAALVAVPAMAMAHRHGRMANDPAAMPMPNASGTCASQQFATGMIGPAPLSPVTSRIAVIAQRIAHELPT